MFHDITSVTLNTAIAGLSERQRVTAHNLANMETPGFVASRVSFEDDLAAAVEAGAPSQDSIGTSRTSDLPGPNGNNVNLDDELVIATETGLQQRLLTNTITSRFGWMNTVSRA